VSSWARIIIGDSRSMREIEDQDIDLVVTSPPYWHIKDYGVAHQIGYGQSLHGYLKDLYLVWQECFRVIREGARLCINIGDQFARAVTYGRYKVIPLHAEVITQCEKIGFDFMGSIIWQKKTTINTTGGGTVMGSFPYPPNGIVEIDYEYIHIFKKKGKARRVSRQVKEASRMNKDEWKTYFSGHWNFGGARKIGHEAMFPDELPKRLIRMFSFVGDTVLDPFLGSGTTVKVALESARNAIGYEINQDFIGEIEEKLFPEGLVADRRPDIEIVRQTGSVSQREAEYQPGLGDVKPGTKGGKGGSLRETLHRVTDIIDAQTLRIDNGQRVKFLGVRIADETGSIEYLRSKVKGRYVFLRFGDDGRNDGDVVSAYVYLKNRIFVNGYLIRSGLGSCDPSVDHRLKGRLREIENRCSA
jgi:DNA modification methylase